MWELLPVDDDSDADIPRRARGPVALEPGRFGLPLRGGGSGDGYAQPATTRCVTIRDDLAVAGMTVEPKPASAAGLHTAGTVSRLLNGKAGISPPDGQSLFRSDLATRNPAYRLHLLKGDELGQERRRQACSEVSRATGSVRYSALSRVSDGRAPPAVGRWSRTCIALDVWMASTGDRRYAVNDPATIGGAPCDDDADAVAEADGDSKPRRGIRLHVRQALVPASAPVNGKVERPHRRQMRHRAGAHGLSGGRRPTVETAAAGGLGGDEAGVPVPRAVGRSA